MNRIQRKYNHKPFTLKCLGSILLCSLIFISSASLGQSIPPEGISFQAVVLDDDGHEVIGVDVSGAPVPNKAIGIRFLIADNSINGTVVYSEEHQTNTDAYGLFNLIIGQGQQTSANAFEDIDWGTNEKFLVVEVDIDQSGQYALLSAQKLWSVPYALYSKYAEGLIEDEDEGFSGDFLFPDGTRDISPFGTTLDDTKSFTVPEGMNLYITNVFTQGPSKNESGVQVNDLTIRRGSRMNSGTGYSTFVGTTEGHSSPSNPIILTEGDVVKGLTIELITVNGFLISKKVEPFTIKINSSYTVPDGKIAVVLNAFTTSLTQYNGTQDSYDIWGGSDGVYNDAPMFYDEGQELRGIDAVINGYYIEK